MIVICTILFALQLGLYLATRHDRQECLRILRDASKLREDSWHLLNDIVIAKELK